MVKMSDDDAKPLPVEEISISEAKPLPAEGISISLFSEPYGHVPSGLWKWGRDGALIRVGGRNDGKTAQQIQEEEESK